MNENLKKQEYYLNLLKNSFIIDFLKLAEEDYNLKGIISLRIAGERRDILEVYFPNKEENPCIHAYLETLIFNKHAYDNLKSMFFKRIVFIYQQECEFEDMSIE